MSNTAQSTAASTERGSFQVGSKVYWYDPDPIEGNDNPRSGVISGLKGDVVTVSLDDGGQAEALEDELVSASQNPHSSPA